MTVLKKIIAISIFVSAFLASCSTGDVDNQKSTKSAKPACTTATFQIAQGWICGARTASGGVNLNSYKGIPYADTSAGDNRWAPPVPKSSWPGIFQATEFGDICPQQRPVGPGVPPQSEDCLSVNVWTPATASATAPLPVLVYIHGGAFIDGASADPVYDGASLSARGVVVVSLNYRLGALGFLGGVESLSGNFGFMDQQLALKWVQANIRNFGGDPNHVTIFGESAGAMSVGLHLLSAPSSRPLFKAVTMESNPMSFPYKDMAEAKNIGGWFKYELGCWLDGIKCMRKKSWQDVVKAEASDVFKIAALGDGFSLLLSWTPIIDGSLIQQDPVTAAKNGNLNLPTILGTNRNEGIIFVEAIGKNISWVEYDALIEVLFGNSNRHEILKRYPAVSGNNLKVASKLVTDYLFACGNRKVAQQTKNRLYAYEFNKVSHFNFWPTIPECVGEVCHADELPYVFNSVGNLPRTPRLQFTNAEQAIADWMGAYWTNFAKAGNDPNNALSPAESWPVFSKSNQVYRIFDTPLSDQVAPYHHCDFWDTIGYDVVDPWALFVKNAAELGFPVEE